MRGERKFETGLSRYIHPISFVAELISITLEKRQRIIEPMNSVVENQDVAVLQRGWRALTSECRRAELPNDLACISVDADDS